MSRAKLLTYNVSDERQPATTVIPAQPGFSVAIFAFAEDDRPAKFHYLPIVGWVCETYDDGAESYPIVAASHTYRSEELIIRWPDGRFSICDSGGLDGSVWLDSEAEALTYNAEMEAAA